MDENKLQKLRDIEYKIRKCCGNCKHAQVHGVYARFGTCAIHQYNHLKHSDNPRQLSISEFGYCEKHELKLFSVAYVGWQEFVEK